MTVLVQTSTRPPLRAPRRYLALLAACAALLALPGTLAAQTAADCLGCHGEASLSTTRKGKTVSLGVDARKFASSAHGQLECVACHQNFNPAVLPHARSITPVDCQTCHSDEKYAQYQQSIHATVQKGGKLAATCADCHSAHEIRVLSGAPPALRKAYAEIVCAKCHAASDTVYKTSAHGVALAGGVEGAPNCIDCHGEHGARAPSDTLAATSRRNVAAMCLKCHRDNPEVGATVGPSAAFVASYENSVHARAVHQGKEEAATCVDCHGAHDLKKGADPTSRVARANIVETCSSCHGDIAEQYKASIHGASRTKGVEAAATCTDCHGEHNILSHWDQNSPVAARNVSAQVCSPCHASVKLTQKFGLASDRFQSFADSYHGLAAQYGSTLAANCASCHRLGTYDASGSAPNLSGDGSYVSSEYTAGVRGHQGITLTSSQISTLVTFLNTH